MRCDPHGVPRAPAGRAKDRGTVTPLRRLGRGQGEPGRLHTTGGSQGEPALPRLVGDGRLELCIVRATVREDDDLPRRRGTASVVQVPRRDVLHHEGRRRAIRQRRRPGGGLATSARMERCAVRKTGRLLRGPVAWSRPAKTAEHWCRPAQDGDGWRYDGRSTSARGAPAGGLPSGATRQRESRPGEAIRQGVQHLLHKTPCVRDKAEPPGDRKPLGICRSPRRKSSAWLRNREVESCSPQR